MSLCGALPAEVLVSRRLANTVLRWSLAGILGAMSLLGNELHEIFGIHHAGHLSGCGHVRSGLAGQVGLSLVAGESQSCDEANCPICNYLAQRSLVGERFVEVPVTLSAPNRSPAVPLFAPSPRLLPFQSRAPRLFSHSSSDLALRINLAIRGLYRIARVSLRRAGLAASTFARHP